MVRGHPGLQNTVPFQDSHGPTAKRCPTAKLFSWCCHGKLQLSHHGSKIVRIHANTNAKQWAWVDNEAGQGALVNAMKRGNELVFKGTSERGTLTTDSYSLKGVTAAMRAIDKACSDG